MNVWVADGGRVFTVLSSLLSE